MMVFTNEKESSQQSAEIVANGKSLLNFCANNYLGLSNHPEVMKASQDMIESHGYGMSSVRFICGTQDIHKELEAKISEFLGTEDTILYAAALMPMVVFSNHFLPKKIVLFLMNSITLLL
jgi:7-keto-8-aminopelargonate synthetase-like enzyme